MFLRKLLIVLACIASVKCDKCPQGGTIYELGISAHGKRDVIDALNSKRLQIAHGNVTGQPKGTNLVRQVYDEKLGEKLRELTLTCDFAAKVPKSKGWRGIMQLTYMTESNMNRPGQHWNEAVDTWFSGHEDYVYPNNPTTNNTKIYTILVQHDVKYIGCDFINFYDNVTEPKYPYVKLYMCAFSPFSSKNFKKPPYAIDGDDKCFNLC